MESDNKVISLTKFYRTYHSVFYVSGVNAYTEGWRQGYAVEMVNGHLRIQS